MQATALALEGRRLATNDATVARHDHLSTVHTIASVEHFARCTSVQGGIQDALVLMMPGLANVEHIRVARPHSAVARRPTRVLWLRAHRVIQAHRTVASGGGKCLVGAALDVGRHDR